MKKGKSKNQEASNKKAIRKAAALNSIPKQRKSLYYLLFKGGLWQ